MPLLTIFQITTDRGDVNVSGVSKASDIFLKLGTRPFSGFSHEPPELTIVTHISDLGLDHNQKRSTLQRFNI